MDCLIVAGGECEKDPLWNFENGKENQEKRPYIIACDRGYENCKTLGIRPDFILGDFDSYKGELPTDIPVKHLPVMKDDSDTNAAVRHAISLGYHKIHICCALGGRFDHSYANLQSAYFAAKEAGGGSLSGNDTFIHFVKAGETLELPSREGFLFSVFSFGEAARGVTIRGALYEVTDFTMEQFYPIGTSNNWKEETAVITLTAGVLMVVESKEN